jgi:uncharacterized membrane protein
MMVNSDACYVEGWHIIIKFIISYSFPYGLMKICIVIHWAVSSCMAYNMYTVNLVAYTGRKQTVVPKSRA